jgi:chromosome segregation ATPase
VQEVQGKREAERNKLIATRAHLRREVAELRSQNHRLSAQLGQERNDRRMAELAARDAAAERNALEAACETAAQEVSRLQDEMARLKAKVTHGAEQAQQRTQVRPDLDSLSSANMLSFSSASVIGSGFPECFYFSLF